MRRTKTRAPSQRPVPRDSATPTVSVTDNVGRARKKKKTPALLMVFLLVGMLILLLLTLWLVVLLLMSPVGLTLRRVLVHVVISLSAVLMLVMSLIGGSLLTFLFLFAFAFVPGWLTLLAQLYVSPVGLLVG